MRGMIFSVRGDVIKEIRKVRKRERERNVKRKGRSSERHWVKGETLKPREGRGKESGRVGKGMGRNHLKKSFHLLSIWGDEEKRR